MKTLIAVLVMVSSVNVLADQACYKLSTTETFITENVPQEICLENLTVDTSKNLIAIYSRSKSDLYKNVKLSYLARKNEDGFNFRASSIVYDSTQGCINFEKVKIQISGITNNYGEVLNLKDLKISSEQEITSDACNMEPRLKVFQYVLK